MSRRTAFDVSWSQRPYKAVVAKLICPVNGCGSHDATKYFMSMPANKLELWFALEAERFQVGPAHSCAQCVCL